MKTLKMILDDDALCSALECEARSSGRSVEEVALDALKLWQMDTELDAEERRDLEAAIGDWELNGGTEAGEFFDDLRREERSRAG